MPNQIYWIPLHRPGRLGIMPRPRGGDWLGDEMNALSRSAVNVLASLLEPAEEQELLLTEERGAAAAAGLRYVSFPIPDRGVPNDRRGAMRLVKDLATAIADAQNVVAHCRGGIGRSGLIACAILMSFGTAMDTAIRSVSLSRGCPVPETDDQIRWLASLDTGVISL